MKVLSHAGRRGAHRVLIGTPDVLLHLVVGDTDDALIIGDLLEVGTVRIRSENLEASAGHGQVALRMTFSTGS